MSNAPQKRQLPFWLMLSLMVNLALVGLVAGMLVKRSDGPHPKPMMERGERHIGDRPDRQDRRVVGKIMREAFIEAAPELEARKAARVALGSAVKTDPLDTEEILSALNALRDADRAMHDVLDAALVSRLETMTPSQREIVAKSLARDPGGRPRRGDRDQGRRDNGPDRPPPPNGPPPFGD